MTILSGVSFTYQNSYVFTEHSSLPDLREVNQKIVTLLTRNKDQLAACKSRGRKFNLHNVRKKLLNDHLEVTKLILLHPNNVLIEAHDVQIAIDEEMPGMLPELAEWIHLREQADYTEDKLESEDTQKSSTAPNIDLEPKEPSAWTTWQKVMLVGVGVLVAGAVYWWYTSGSSDTANTLSGQVIPKPAQDPGQLSHYGNNVKLGFEKSHKFNIWNDKAASGVRADEAAPCSTAFKLTSEACSRLKKWYKEVTGGKYNEINLLADYTGGFRNPTRMIQFVSQDNNRINLYEGDFKDATFDTLYNWKWNKFYY